MRIQSRFSRKKGGTIKSLKDIPMNMLSEFDSVPANDLMPFKKGGWIQKATASIKRRGTEGVCTGSKFGGPTCRPGTKRYNLAKTFRKMAKKNEGGLLLDPVNSIDKIAPKLGIGAPDLPDLLGEIVGRTLSREVSEVPVKSRKVNAYNYKKGRPMTGIERLFRQKGGRFSAPDNTVKQDATRVVNPKVQVAGKIPVGDFTGMEYFKSLFTSESLADESKMNRLRKKIQMRGKDEDLENMKMAVELVVPPKKQDGGTLQGTTFRPSDVQEQLPDITQAQLADLLMQASQNNQGVVSDTIQYNVPQITDPNQREVPMQITTPSSDFSITGYNLGAPSAGKQVAPILPQRAYGGKVKKKKCGGKLRRKCGGVMTKFSK